MAESNSKRSHQASTLNQSEHLRQSHSAKAGRGEFVPYDDEYVKLNSTLQVAWSESLAEDIFTSSTNYTKVEVLMLSWDPKFDDLKVQGEITELKDVFENQFNFHVTLKKLERVEHRRTQAQINMIVAQWVWEYDRARTLLIVYFAGHGRPGKRGELELAGQKSPSDLRDYLDKVVWNKTEQNLLDVSSDVLQIFDCCFAGTIETRGQHQGASEFLAATSAGATTPRPGESSFTTALIWALRDLLKHRKCFTTSDLTNKITEAPAFPPGQRPVLSRRGHDSFSEQQLIVLRPLRNEAPASPATPVTRSSDLTEITNHDVVTFKFVFSVRPDASVIRKIGQDMNHVVVRNELKLNRIMFAGIQPKRNDMVFRAISKFRALGGLRRRSVYGDVTSGAAAHLIDKIEDDVEEHVLGRLEESKASEMEAKRRDFDDFSTSVRARHRQE